MKKATIPQLLTVQWLREKYRNREISPEEVLLEIIDRVQRDDDLHIWITPPSMASLRPYLERLGSLAPETLPLWGVPFAVKDNIDVSGLTTTAACPDYAYLPDRHAKVVERLVAAGAIPLGKTNLDQFATGLVGTRSPYGETRNALKPELISGGSSSGSAVSVARGHAAFALGTDTAGSGRVPAALNRLVGFKPSLGAWSTQGVVPACASLDCVTVFAHNVDDMLAVDQAARGFEEMDPWSRNINAPQPGLPEKIILPKEAPAFYGPYAEEYRSAWEAAVEKLQQLHVPVEYADFGLFSEAAAVLYEGPWIAERWASLGEFIESHPGSALPVTEHILRSGAADAYSADAVFKAIHKLQSIKSEARRLLQGAVMVMPTCGGTWTREQVRTDPVSTNRDMGRYTNHCNLLDLCAAAVPAGDAAEDVPFGITFFASADNEGLICGMADLFTNAAAAPSPSSKPTAYLAVCGLHMRGLPLEKQMLACGAHFIREDLTAAKYKFVKLPTTPAKPGLIKLEQGGESIALEIWEMPLEALGSFVDAIPAPLGVGKVELLDGSEVTGFLCEAYAAAGAEDITSSKSWRHAVT